MPTTRGSGSGITGFLSGPRPTGADGRQIDIAHNIRFAKRAHGAGDRYCADSLELDERSPTFETPDDGSISYRTRSLRACGDDARPAIGRLALIAKFRVPRQSTAHTRSAPVYFICYREG
jgi:hypothetical protein